MKIPPDRVARARFFFREQYPFAYVMAGFLALLVFHGGSLTQNYYYILLLLPFVLAITISDLRDFLRNPVIIAFAIYLTTLWLSLVWTEQAPATFLLRYGRKFVVELAFVAHIAWLLRRDRAATVLILSIAFGIDLFIALVLSLWWFVGADFGGRVALFMWHNPNTGAAISGVAVLLLGGAWGSSRSNFLRFVIALLSLSLLTEIVLSSSRATIVGVLMAFFACLLSRRSLPMLVLAAIAVSIIAIVASKTGLVDVSDYFARGDSARFDVWRAFWPSIQDHFWTGIGIKNQFELTFDIHGGKIDNPHNMVLLSFLYAGVLAAIAWVGLLVVMGKSLVSAARSGRSGNQLAVAMFVYILMHGLVESVLLVEVTDWQWMYLLVPIACITSAAFPDRVATQEPIAACRAS